MIDNILICTALVLSATESSYSSTFSLKFIDAELISKVSKAISLYKRSRNSCFMGTKNALKVYDCSLILYVQYIRTV